MRVNGAGVGVSANKKRALSLAAVAGVAGLALAPAAYATEDGAVITAADADVPNEVSSVDVTAENQQKASSPKYTAELRDTPQTVTVLSERTIREQNLLTLRDILQTVPGITFGAGEGGGGYGDSINLRGYSANNDITTDGLRDSAQYSRTDPFNLQQIEVVNGANGAYSGSGGVGGTINLVSKQPAGRDVSIVSAGLGTDGYLRFTADIDRSLTDTIAIRVNVMGHQNDVPGRDVETYERWGIAPSITFGVDQPTRFTIAYFHQEDENTPRYGVPYASNAFLNGPLPGVDPSNYYGYRNLDRQEIGVDTLTLKFVHEFSEDLTITNTSRWARISQLTLVDAPQGTWCLASGFNAQTGAACGTPGLFSPTASGPRGNLRDSENTQLVTQTDLNWRFNTGPFSHNLVVGFSISNETYDLSTGNVLRTDQAQTVILTPISIANPNSVYAGPVNYFETTASDGELSNQAVYLFDAVEFTPQWSLNFGLRWENNEGEFISTPFTYTANAPNPPIKNTGLTTIAKNEETLFSWRVGLVFKPAEEATLYVAVANVSTPSQATVNSGCSTTGANQNCNLDPEEGELIEVGFKWDVLGGRLSLNGSAFQNTRSQIRLNSNDPAIPIQQQDGESRVRGVTLGLSGQITPEWVVIANYTWLNSEILRNVASTALPPNNIDFTRGDPLPNTPEHAFNIWTTYQVTPEWMVGFGATYSGQYAFPRVSATAPLLYSDRYWILNAAVTWNVTENLDLQFNAKNLADEEYYTNIRSSSGFGWALPSDARSFTVTANYRF